ncbi:MAG: hypothetical protein ACXVAU_02075 [Mucilaginibacter sp.]
MKGERSKAKGAPKSEVGLPKSDSEQSAPVTPHAAPKKELQTANSKLQTENMEVHHHPQLEHKPKPWKEYLLEGLMIFLAVTMGFFAESIRENITNREHAEQLTMQLVTELKSDTVQLRQIDSAESKIQMRIDTLLLSLQQPMAKADMKNIQRLINRCYSLWPFHPNTGAINAIKNEIRIKQLSNSKIAYYIAGYEGRIAIEHKLEDMQGQLMDRVIQSFLSEHFTQINLHAIIDGKPIVNAQTRNLTQNDLTQLAVNMELIRGFNKNQLQYIRATKNDAIELINYVKKQYELADE